MTGPITTDKMAMETQKHPPSHHLQDVAHRPYRSTIVQAKRSYDTQRSLQDIPKNMDSISTDQTVFVLSLHADSELFSDDPYRGTIGVYTSLDVAMEKGVDYVDAILDRRLSYHTPRPRNLDERCQKAREFGWEMTRSGDKDAYKYEICYNLYHSHRLWAMVQEWTVHTGD